MNSKMLILLYSLFAAIATIVNLSVQRIILNEPNTPLNLTIAICAGSLAGLSVKYQMDKRWIFQDHRIGIKFQSVQFSIYSLNGVFTTAIFWLSEFSFWYIWNTHLMRELGAVIGLSIGYIAKYKLDTRYVFIESKKQGRP